MLKGTVTSNGNVTWQEENSAVVTQFLTRPRLACRNGEDYPDCVLVTTDGYDHVRLSALTAGEPWTITSQTVMSNSSRHEIDVAMSGRINGADHAVIVRMADTYDDFRAWWGSWALNNNGTLTQGTFVGPMEPEGPLNLHVREPPRVAFHRTVTNFSGTTGVFVAVLMDMGGHFRVSVSSDHTGTGWGPAQPADLWKAMAVPAQHWDEAHGFGHYDVACANHQTTDNECRVVFNRRLSGLDSAEMDAELANNQVACWFTVQNLTHQVSTWTCNYTQLAEPNQVSLTDYEPFSGGYPQPAWMLLAGRSNPFSFVNTVSVFSQQDSPLLFREPHFNIWMFDTPLQVSGAPPYNLWGGMSCDWVDYADRFVCAQPKEPSRW